MYSPQFPAIMARSRRKVISLFILCFGFTFVVHTFHQVFENSEQRDVQELTPEQTPPHLHDYPNTLKPVHIQLRTVWTYRCEGKIGCVRELRKENEEVVGTEVCWLTCGPYGSIWPYPTGKTSLGKCLVPFHSQGMYINSSAPSPESQKILEEMQKVFMNTFQKTVPEDDRIQMENQEKDDTWAHSNQILINISVVEEAVKIGLETNESYSMLIVSDEGMCRKGEFHQVRVQIKAGTIFGARHALQSLSQLIAYDGDNKCFQILGDAEIVDSPAFPYRGLLIDTARTFIPIKDLKRMVDAMSYNKLNMFHWHLTDSNSFPYFSKRVPEMSQYGAYSSSKVYYPDQVKELIQYALIRGVKIIPELDAPAHAGNGWQWGPSKGLGNLAVCVNAEDWRSYCGQPPCGQLNPTNINVYITLEKIYRDMLEEFDSDLFHMGGDEVYRQCWETDPTISNWKNKGRRFNYMELWGFFQVQALKKLREANSGNPLRPIVWTSAMTQTSAGRAFLNSSDYIIQVWENGKSSIIQTLLEENYQLIMSNSDVMYLDHGAGSWLGKDHIYEYKQWQVMYDNRLSKFFRNISLDKMKPCSERQILGGETTLWSEKVNSENMDGKTWPRGSAVAENLWSDPKSRPSSVYSRLNHHTNRMIQLGIRADQLQPESCYQLTGHCQDIQKPI